MGKNINKLFPYLIIIINFKKNEKMVNKIYEPLIMNKKIIISRSYFIIIISKF